MWIVVSTNNINLLQSEIKKKISDIKFYYPKIRSSKKGSEKNILGNYVFCYSKNFSEENTSTLNLKFVKGLKKILFSKKRFNDEVLNFINYCKSHEDQNGFLKNTFFKEDINDEGRFLNGPFSNYIFSLIKKEKKKIQVLVGAIKVSISDKGKFNYSTI
tara:strand:+ start:190 stop:666 length:477 start_codon:yes stop_codon:yes gene_type:complete